ncbi:hypothetical protein QQM41_04350 [Acetobacter sp. AC2005]|uniref:hypothetical protein n=1 Tax=Acetobacter sp. AC2005 TaxID=3134142 RepID=UPI0030D272CE
MKLAKFFLWIIFLFLSKNAVCSDMVDSNTLNGKLIMGYQGWFHCPTDDAYLGWGHWKNGENMAVDMLPDMADFSDGEKCKTLMRDKNNNTINLFTNSDPKTIEKHFYWMKKYGIDGVAVQRFANIILDDNSYNSSNIELKYIKNSSERNGRVFYVMYDLSGFPDEKLNLVVNDWENIIKSGITKSPSYLRHHGKPVLAIWGLGFSGRSLTPQHAVNLLKSLKDISNDFGGVTFIGGVPAYWNEGINDADNNPDWKKVWSMLSVISPWTVGRYKNIQESDKYKDELLKPDINFTHKKILIISQLYFLDIHMPMVIMLIIHFLQLRIR